MHANTGCCCCWIVSKWLELWSTKKVYRTVVRNSVSCINLKSLLPQFLQNIVSLFDCHRNWQLVCRVWIECWLCLSPCICHTCHVSCHSLTHSLRAQNHLLQCMLSRDVCLWVEWCLFVYRKARSLDADLHVISTSLKSVEISEQMVGTLQDRIMLTVAFRTCRSVPFGDAVQKYISGRYVLGIGKQDCMFCHLIWTSK